MLQISLASGKIFVVEGVVAIDGPIHCANGQRNGSEFLQPDCAVAWLNQTSFQVPQDYSRYRASILMYIAINHRLKIQHEENEAIIPDLSSSVTIILL